MDAETGAGVAARKNADLPVRIVSALVMIALSVGALVAGEPWFGWFVLAVVLATLVEFVLLVVKALAKVVSVTYTITVCVWVPHQPGIRPVSLITNNSCAYRACDKSQALGISNIHRKKSCFLSSSEFLTLELEHIVNIYFKTDFCSVAASVIHSNIGIELGVLAIKSVSNFRMRSCSKSFCKQLSCYRDNPAIIGLFTSDGKVFLHRADAIACLFPG